MNFVQMKNKVVAWFWKMGYMLGQQVGNLGKGLVDEAFHSGFKNTVFDNLRMSELLDNLSDQYDDEMAAMAGTILDVSAMSAGDFSGTFSGLFEEYYDSAHSLFTDNGWTMLVGAYTNNTFTPNLAGDHLMYTKPGETEEVIMYKDNTDPNNVIYTLVGN